MFGGNGNGLEEVAEAVELTVQIADEFDDLENPENVEKATETVYQLVELTQSKSTTEKLIEKLIENPELAERALTRATEAVADGFFSVDGDGGAGLTEQAERGGTGERSKTSVEEKVEEMRGSRESPMSESDVDDIEGFGDLEGDGETSAEPISTDDENNDDTEKAEATG